MLHQQVCEITVKYSSPKLCTLALKGDFNKRKQMKMQTIPEEKKNGNKDAQVPSPEMLATTLTWKQDTTLRHE